MSGEQTLRYGLLGLGSMGRHHARNIRNLPGVELVAVADPQGDPYGVADGLNVLSDVKELVKEGIDAAVVAVPTAFHCEVALQLAEAGVHTLVEKPLASTLEEGREIVEAFESAGLVGAVGYVERCNPAMVALRQKLDEGVLGEIFQLTTRRQSPFPARISDVGVVKDLATHDVDLAAWIANSPYSSVSAEVSYRSGRKTEDMLLAVGQLQNGIIVNHQVNWLTPYKDRTVVVTGEAGALVAETVLGDLTFYENGVEPLKWAQIENFRGVSEGQVVRYAIPKREPLQVEHENFRDAILGKRSDHVTMAQSMHTMHVVQALLDSAEKHEVVRLAE